MTIQSKREYVQAIKARYRNASKQEKARILYEFCTICSYNRKYAIRLLNQKKRFQKKTSPGPNPGYS